jgi:hypothetical protein
MISIFFKEKLFVLFTINWKVLLITNVFLTFLIIECFKLKLLHFEFFPLLGTKNIYHIEKFIEGN